MGPSYGRLRRAAAGTAASRKVSFERIVVRVIPGLPSRRTIEPSLEQILAFCAEDPVERVFLSAVQKEGRLTALCHIGANVVPSGTGCAVFADAVARGRARMLIGEEVAVEELWQAARRRMAPPRTDRSGQPVYVIDEPPLAGNTGLRLATSDDLDVLVPACAAAHYEELQIDPLARDRDGFIWRTRAQIDEGRSWIWREGNTILFKAEASAWTPSAVQLQQVWSDPPARGQGNANRALRDLIRLLLRQAPTVCLFVRPENAVALRTYEAVGMRRTITYRSLIF
jgi:ribosomal protein S18 acetylase RimI-like enzyme